MIKIKISLFAFSRIIFIVLIAFNVNASEQKFTEDEAPHHLSIFIGDTHVIDENEDGYTIGIDYEYRVNEVLGIGTVIEHAAQDIKANTILAVADIHTPIGLIFQIGPGYEFGEDENNPLFRFGGLYEFEYESYTISPQVHFDMVKDEDNSLVFGFAIGRAF